MSAPSFIIRRVCVAFVAAAALAFTASLTAQIPTRNVNMVSGLEWPGGDPFLQRQNEPSIAASTRNPLHLLAGSNDYRSIDLAGILGNDNEVGDAWAGLYTSTDGGERWTSTLVPGYPHDPDPRGQASPLYGYQAAADPVVRAGTNGLMYFAGLAFDRSAAGFGKSAIYVARFIDNNNQEAASPFEYINTSLVASQPATTGVFLDKPWMAVDIPRQGAGTCNITTVNEHGPFTQRLPAGNVYVAFTIKSEDALGERWDLYFSRSTDCGVQFSTPVRISRAQDRVNQGASIVISPTTGAVFISWRRIDLNPTDGLEEHAIVVAKSIDQGRQFNNPGVARRFPRGRKRGLDPAGKPGNGKGKLNQIQASAEFELSPLDQATSDINKQFRTNAYPTMAADGTGRLYLAWTERGFAQERSDPGEGDARIVVASSMDGVTWTLPTVVSDGPGQKGHQLMPALSFAGGKLMMIYYDLQEDKSQVFKKSVDDRSAILESNPVRRHTFDVRVAMASPGPTPAFVPSQSVSSYLRGSRGPSTPVENLQVNPPNLPMFKLGTVPFIGDYIDLAPSPSFVPNGSGGWIYNTAATTTPPVFHAVWTDNRDVKPPYTRNWTDYTPPTYSGPRPDPGAPITVCLAGLAGSRNQNIYTARITGGLVVGSPQNSKQLSTTLQRAFVVFAQNTSESQKTFRMTILNQPVNGRASFTQYPLPPFNASSDPPLTWIDMTIPRYTTASRTVYVTSSDAHAPVNVDVSEIPSLGSPTETPGGLEGMIRLNPDVLNPEVDNPEVDNPEVDNPEVDNAEVYNPEVDNPEVDNPEVDNPEVDNPEVDNPEVDNIVVGNPEVDNPEVDNPEVDNPEVDNPEVDNPEVDNAALLNGGGIITDITWTIKNIGNTTTAYNINLFNRHATPPADGKAQLLIYRVYKTPMIKAASCDLKTVTQNVLIANIPDPALIPPGGEPSNPNDSGRTNGTLWLEPEHEVRVTMRVFDPIKADNITLPNGASIDLDWIPESDVSLFAQSQPVNTPDAATINEPPLVGADPGATFTVTNTNNAGAGSLRDAMTQADATPGYDAIAFNIPGAGPHTILPASPLPVMTEPVTIDGSTQPGYAGVPLIVLDGSGSGGGSGLRLQGGISLVRALTINNWGDVGIGLSTNGGNEIYGNYIGVTPDGTAQAINGLGGISVDSDANIIGGIAPTDRNLISGNGFAGVLVGASSNRLIGNYIGVNAAGDAAIANSEGVVMFAGTANVLERNLISGNFAAGVAIGSSSNVLRFNRIGTNAAGIGAIGNDVGVAIRSGQNNLIGEPGAGNVLSGNTRNGVLIGGGGAPAEANVIRGNLIGTDVTGSFAVANLTGVEFAGSARNILGGAAPADRNIISGNANGVLAAGSPGPGPVVPAVGNVIVGNYIGLNAAGNGAIPNNRGVTVGIAQNTQVGAPGAGNVISGNAISGIAVTGFGGEALNTSILGNSIGTSPSGNAAIANAFYGVEIESHPAFAGFVTNTVLGSSVAGGLNIISGNGSHGVLIQGGNTIGTNIASNLIGIGKDGVTDVGNGGAGVAVNDAPNTTVSDNVLSGNGSFGLMLTATPAALVTGNRIGTNAAATGAVANLTGVLVTGNAPGVVIGGATSRNVIAGNTGHGLVLEAKATTAINNYIGTNGTGTAALPNSIGIDVIGDGNIIGQVGLGNLISGNSGLGIRVRGWSNVVRANRIGTNDLGNAAVGNGIGVAIDNRFDVEVDAVIGGELAGEGNVISGNAGPGIAMGQQLVNPALLNPEIGNPPPWFTDVKGNFIGTAANGVDPLPNAGHGITAAAVSAGLIGGATAASENVIAYNAMGGVFVVDDARVTIERSFIHTNGGLEIDLGNDGVSGNDALDGDAGPNSRQNYPVISAAAALGGNTEVSGTLQSAPGGAFTIRFYETDTCDISGHGGSKTYRSTIAVVTNVAGMAAFNHVYAGVAVGSFVTATATDPFGNTSEFAQCRVVTP